MNRFFKSVLRTAALLLEVSDRIAADMRDRAAAGFDRVGDQVSDLRDRTRNISGQESHTFRNVIGFAAGVGLGVGAGMLLAPASGRETRDSIGKKVRDMGAPIRDRFASEVSKATGTEGS
jgi:YtxH-like protein